MYKIKFKDESVKEFNTLAGADLRNADLRDTCLYNANLSNADLEHCKGIITFCLEEYRAIYYKCDNEYRLKMGCKDHDIQYWLDNYRHVGKAYGFTEDQIEAYGDFIKLVSKMEIV